MSRTAAAVLLAALCLSHRLSEAGELPARPARTAAIGPRTAPPRGWVEFCERYAGECEKPVPDAPVFRLTAENFVALQLLNVRTNKAIVAVTDWEHWGVSDRWDFAEDGRGDCEDYVLIKRRDAVKIGIPLRALLVTIVLDARGEGHAVLTVATDRGDYILDNLRDPVLPWTDTDYQYLARQSQAAQNLWVSIEQPATSPALVATNR